MYSLLLESPPWIIIWRKIRKMHLIHEQLRRIIMKYFFLDGSVLHLWNCHEYGERLQKPEDFSRIGSIQNLLSLNSNFLDTKLTKITPNFGVIFLRFAYLYDIIKGIYHI